MYILKTNKFGLKQYYTSLRVSKIFRKMTEILEQYEIGITKKEIQTQLTLGLRLKALKQNETLKLLFRNTKIEITKAELLKK